MNNTVRFYNSNSLYVNNENYYSRGNNYGAESFINLAAFFLFATSLIAVLFFHNKHLLMMVTYKFPLNSRSFFFFKYTSSF